MKSHDPQKWVAFLEMYKRSQKKNPGFYREFARVPPRDLLDATTNWGMRPRDPHAPHSAIARFFKYHEISPSYEEFFLSVN